MKRSLITNNQQIMRIFQRRLSRKMFLKVITPSHFDRHLHSSWLSKNPTKLLKLCCMAYVFREITTLNTVRFQFSLCKVTANG